jgi:hypothetical protein
MTRHCPVTDLWWALADHDRLVDERLAMTTRAFARHTQCPTGAKASGKLPSQGAALLNIQRLVNRFATDAHGRGRWMDNVFIERLWRSLKYECVYLHAFETGSELRTGLGQWITYYNTQRPHSGVARQTG